MKIARILHIISFYRTPFAELRQEYAELKERYPEPEPEPETIAAGEEGTTDLEAERYYAEASIELKTSIVTLFIHLTSLIAIKRSSKVLMYLPWIMLVDAIFYFPLSSNFVTNEQIIMAISVLFQLHVANISFVYCNNMIETIVISFILELRFVFFLKNHFQFPFRPMMLPTCIILAINFTFIHYMVVNTQIKLFMAQNEI